MEGFTVPTEYRSSKFLSSEFVSEFPWLLNHHIFRNEAPKAFFEPLFHAKDAPKPDVRQEGFNRPTTTTPIVRDRSIEQRH